MLSIKKMSEDRRTFLTSFKFLAEDYPNQYIGATVHQTDAEPVYVLMATGRGIPTLAAALEEAGFIARLHEKVCGDHDLYARLESASAMTLSQFCPEGQALIFFCSNLGVSLIVVNDRGLVADLTAWGISRATSGEGWN